MVPANRFLCEIVKNAIAIFVLLTLAMLGVSGAGSVKGGCTKPAMEESCAMECCAEMACCVQRPVQPLPESGQHRSPDFSIALVASSRPLLGLLWTGQRDFCSTVRAPLGRSRDSLALLCVRLI